MAYTCPHCQVGVPDVKSTIREHGIGFNHKPLVQGSYNADEMDLKVVMMLCPNCENKSYWVYGVKKILFCCRSSNIS